ncbi:MAG: group II intron reverse transcriptase/maturase [Rivularia sp. (in: cyanobacteria)]
MNTELKPMYEWKTVPWNKIQRNVFKLQKRIYQASSRGDVKTVHRLQRLLAKSRSAKLLAVRKVTQDNQGLKTAGVDGVKSLTQKERLVLALNLKLNQKAKPTRRVWISKPGTMEKRPLGIPTISDRASQALVKLMLEPEWEAKFEPNSFGFRPGRSCHDAIVAIHSAINTKAKYALDADIAKCFDRINHQALLDKIGTYPKLRTQIKSWLKSGVMDGKCLFPTREGTPQGGIISPLLANIALHGLEEEVRRHFKQTKSVNKVIISQNWKPFVIRYADDFVVFHEDLSVIKECQSIIKSWLKGMGLELKPSKTRICHTLENLDGKVGFDFLGFEIRQVPRGKNYSAKNTNGKILGYKTRITASKKSIKTHLKNIREVIDKYRGGTQVALIKQLNPIIRGWCNYYSIGLKRTFSKVHHKVYQMLRAWAKNRHPMKNMHWIVNKYWAVDEGMGWEFVARFDGKFYKLFKHQETPIKRHIKIKVNKSPFDADWVYWANRIGKLPDVKKQVAKLVKRQKGKCPKCGLFFQNEDLMEIHHIDGNHHNNNHENLLLLHRHCHDQVHSMN